MLWSSILYWNWANTKNLTNVNTSDYWILFSHFRSQKENGSDPQSPVREWWRDLHAWCEPECMTYLQSKPIQNSPLSHRDGTSSTSGLSSDISGSSMLSHNSMSSTKSSVSSPNGSYLNYDTDNLESLKNIRKLLSGANDILSTFDSMTKYVFQILHLEQFFPDLTMINKA